MNGENNSLIIIKFLSFEIYFHKLLVILIIDIIVKQMIVSYEWNRYKKIIKFLNQCKYYLQKSIPNVKHLSIDKELYLYFCPIFWQHINRMSIELTLISMVLKVVLYEWNS